MSDVVTLLVGECKKVLGAAPDEVESLTHSVRATTTSGVTRVRAAGRSAVLKVVAPRSFDPADASHRPASFRYWRREERLLASELLEPYHAAGIRPPAVLARFERGDDSLALWLEDVAGTSGDDWSLDGFGDAARRLGVAQGEVAVAGPSAVGWLSRGFLREYLADVLPRVPYEALDDDRAWREPLVVGHFPIELRVPLGRLHAEQERFLAWVEAAPMTLAHLDVWPRNLFAAPDGTVLIDWAFAGIGALGEDIGNLVPDSVWDLLHPASILSGLDGVVFEGYVEGLRAGGWRGDERRVRLAMCASVVKYDWIAPVMLAQASRDGMLGYGGQPIEDREQLYEERGVALAFMVERAEEARRLAAELGA